MDMIIANSYENVMTHASILQDLGITHAARAKAIGHGCEGYQVRDWMRRGGGNGSIPQEWFAHVADAHPRITVRDLADIVAVKAA